MAALVDKIAAILKDPPRLRVGAMPQVPFAELRDMQVLHVAEVIAEAVSDHINAETDRIHREAFPLKAVASTDRETLEFRARFEACARIMADAGIDIRAPWQCSLDDVERSRYEAFDRALTVAADIGVLPNAAP